MKFKYIGQSRVKDLDLVLAKIMKPTDVLINGMIITVPDSETQLIKRLEINGNFEVYNEPKKFKKPFKKDKETEKEDK
ncbi:MAG: hypothetical protein IJ258_00020 [Methanobrevibacter sp.]|uniref:hypothetical protein n=1 Tax=Methanobrevibacter sp. TaxID=66852 RepID=UPI0025F66A10|nr:hypothetical protein [Methanobrevibacter sp.]MBQ8016468.1 hypothetical protein [Methanobrevibacter sp.]